MLRFIVLFLLANIPLSGQSRLVKSLINKDVEKEVELLIERVNRQIKGDNPDSALVPFSKLNKDKNCFYTKNGRPFTGYYFKYDSSNYITSVGMVKDGKDDRMRIEFGRDKKVRSITLINDSGICYNWKYYSNGNLQFYSRNKDNFDCILFDRLFGGSDTDGDYYNFYENGQLRCLSHLRDRTYSGERMNYYDNGKRKEKCYFKNKEMAGVWKQYNRRGRCTAKIYYKDGKPVKTKGVWKKWSELE
jgi:antitoxin component YwqK of YwqJK toxin-antitoxin module